MELFRETFNILPAKVSSFINTESEDDTNREISDNSTEKVGLVELEK